MTLDGLARLVAEGFEDVKMTTKADLDDLESRLRAEFTTKLEIHDLEERLTSEIRKVQDQMGCEDAEHLHEMDATTERRFQGIEKRLGKLEKQAR